MAIVAPYLIGVVTAPLAAGVLRPVARGIIKAAVTVTTEVKRAAAEAREGVQGIAAEVEVDKAAEAKVARGARV
jgi:hypothetical protein